MKLIPFQKKNVVSTLSKKKKWGILITCILIFVASITTITIYFQNTEARNFIDRYILRRTIYENNLNKIEIETDVDKTIFAYDKEIAILQKNTLTRYNGAGKENGQVTVEITTPIYDTQDKFLILGEKGAQKLYLIQENAIKWEKEVDGDVVRVAVNRNGYTAIVLANTTYKSIIIVYDVNGKELFRNYLSSTIAVNIDISNDNKYLAYAEISTGGTFIQSNIKIVSIEKAQADPSNSYVYTYAANTGSLVVDIAYQDKNTLAVMFDDSIYTITNNQQENLWMNLQEKDEKIDYAGNLMDNAVYRMIEQSVGIFKTNTMVEIKNTHTGKEAIYTVEGVPKGVATSRNLIAINLGREVHILNTNGWLLKKYTSEQDVKDMIVCDGLVGIVYRDKIECIPI